MIQSGDDAINCLRLTIPSIATQKENALKKGNPKTTGESDDEINKLEYRNKVPRIPVENYGSEADESVTVVKPSPKNISMIDLCNAPPTEDQSKSDMDISGEGKKEKEKEDEDDVSLFGESASDNNNDEENTETKNRKTQAIQLL